MLTGLQEKLNSILDYDPITGLLFWKTRPPEMFLTNRDCLWWNKRFAGKLALNSENGDGYKSGSIFSKNYKAHRIIWAMVYGNFPVNQIDHINGDRSDNRLSNLREVSLQDNVKNQKRRATNTSGCTGVYWYPRYNKWVVKISRQGKSVTVGYFSSFDDAVSVRKGQECLENYHENHDRFVEA